MASDLISRQKILNDVGLYMAENAYLNDTALDVLKMISKWVQEAPAVDAEPVRHGRWEWLGPNSMVSGCMCGTCSVCKVRSKYIVNVGICPNCGAMMNAKDTNAPTKEG